MLKYIFTFCILCILGCRQPEYTKFHICYTDRDNNIDCVTCTTRSNAIFQITTHYAGNNKLNPIPRLIEANTDSVLVFEAYKITYIGILK